MSPETVPCWHWWLRGAACLTVALLSGLTGTKRWCQWGEAALAPVCSVISQTNPTASAKNAMAPASVLCNPNADWDLTGLTPMSTPHLVCGQLFLWTKRWRHSLCPTGKQDWSRWKHGRVDLHWAIILQNKTLTYNVECVSRKKYQVVNPFCWLSKICSLNRFEDMSYLLSRSFATNCCQENKTQWVWHYQCQKERKLSFQLSLRSN